MCLSWRQHRDEQSTGTQHGRSHRCQAHGPPAGVCCRVMWQSNAALTCFENKSTGRKAWFALFDATWRNDLSMRVFERIWSYRIFLYRHLSRTISTWKMTRFGSGPGDLLLLSAICQAHWLVLEHSGSWGWNRNPRDYPRSWARGLN